MSTHSAARRRALGALGAAPLAAAPLAGRATAPVPQSPPDGRKVLRYAFPIAETGFDPAQISDLYSRHVTAHIFESPLAFDHLARPFKLRLCTAAEMPVMSSDYRTCTVKLRPGIYFADDPAFKGKRRELVAEDYVYSWKRFFDPRVKAPYVASFMLIKLEGFNEYREHLLKTRERFDYDLPLPGMRALDRYTLQFRLAEPEPRFLYQLTTPDIAGAVAREVVEFYGENIMAHPVGTGPFRLVEWRRSSKIVLERNPTYREVTWEAEPNANDLAGQELARRMRGKRLPLLDRVEISVVEEQQPRFLAFLNREHDLLERIGPEFATIAVPNGRLAPNLARQGIHMERVLGADLTMTLYNMDHPVVGAYTPEKVALRRAINLAIDVDKEIRLVRRGQAIPAQGPVMPHTYGYDPDFKSEMGEFSQAKARALLDAYGYVDRNGDGWREMPDGSPLVLEYATQPDQASRQLNELWRGNLRAVGLRIEFRPAKWPENLKSARAGKVMMWGVGLSASSPDGQGVFGRGYSPDIGGQNLARFKMPEFDRIYEQMKRMPDGPERLELFTRLSRIMIAYAPYKFHVHRIYTDLMHPWLTGYRRPVFWNEWWHYADIDPELRAGV
jgi:ABC-type transport system substrate-binding protein